MATTLNYNLGRVTTYAILGLLFGSIGMSLREVMPIMADLLRGLAAVLMICMGLYIGGWWMGLRHLENVGHQVWEPIRRYAGAGGATPGFRGEYWFGMIWGCLPCGLVFTLLAYAMTTGDMLQGGLIMVSFGLGTIPTLFLVGAFANRVMSIVRRKAVRSVMASMVILFGAWTMTGVLGVNIGGHEGGHKQQKQLDEYPGK
jgi:sulfite exporter TauE/SafE